MVVELINIMNYKFDEEQHVHLLDDAPLIGTSSMSSILNKPGLTYWASSLAVEKFGWINKGNSEKGWVPKFDRIKAAVQKRKEIISLDDEKYLDLLDEAYSAHTKTLKSSAKAGTDMHEVMEQYVKMCISDNGCKPILIKTEHPKLKIFSDWAILNVKKFLWSEAHCYSKELWLGGISDAGFEDKDGKIAILDFKSSKDVYLSQFWQCVGYAIQIEENGLFTKDGQLIMKLEKEIDYVAVLPFGMEKPEVKTNVDMSGGRDAVRAMVLLYKKLN